MTTPSPSSSRHGRAEREPVPGIRPGAASRRTGGEAGNPEPGRGAEGPLRPGSGQEALSGQAWRDAVKAAQSGKRAPQKAPRRPAQPAEAAPSSGATLTAAAHCGGCEWTAEGTPAEVDKAAEKHVRPGHATATAMEPVGSAA